ncbi:MAG: hypothetical protein H0W68_01735, partial [Gemmatimonadaceae bacterium]|nr:hypothetical protein [Gemmatimonadaceae bacterium]
MIARRWLAVAALFVALPAAAQKTGAATRRCQFVFENATPNTHLFSVELPSKQRNVYIGGGIIARCPSEGQVLRSDSLEVYGDEGRYFFIGHVDYVDRRIKLKSEYLTYFQREERLLAVITVDATLSSGSTLKGNQLEVWRAQPRIRPQRAVATGRPTISLVERDPQGRAQPPVVITGNIITLEGDSTVFAQGEVTVVRPELRAQSDSLHLDGARNVLHLIRNPKITGTKGRPFTLEGKSIDLVSRRRKLERVVAMDSGEATSEDLTLQADTIDMRIADDLLQRAVAWGRSRARAVSPTQTITSDSIDVIMPAQRVRELHAVRKAVAEAVPDTSHFKTKERDRLSGDTIVARFDSIPARDTISKSRVRLLVATGSATALQHLVAKDTACHLPQINYVTGQTITVHFDSAGVSRGQNEKSSGVLLEPDASCGKSVAGATRAAGSGSPASSAPASNGQPPPAAPPARPPVAPPVTAPTTPPPQ